VLDFSYKLCYSLYTVVALSANYTAVCFTVKKTTVAAFRRKHPRYGEVSRVMRELLEAYTEGRLRIDLKKGDLLHQRT
jgi:hypothetical protein